MNREDLLKQVLSVKSNKLVLELATGYGKTKLGLEYSFKDNPKDVLIVINRTVHIENWKREISKWGFNSDICNFINYRSLHKLKNTHFDSIILDEAHNITENNSDFLKYISYNKVVLLSATINKDKKHLVGSLYPNYEYICINRKQAFEDKTLPEPKVYPIRIFLNNKIVCEEYIVNKKGKKTITIGYKDFTSKYLYKKRDNTKFIVKCTQEQYYKLLENDISYLKRSLERNPGNIFLKNKYLFLCNHRLKILAKFKEPIALDIVSKTKGRKLLFCSDIKQTKLFTKNNINSKNKNSEKILSKFNNKEIDTISACNQLDEGVNLTDCKYGIFININASERMNTQKIGRILRHKEPTLIYIYYKDTREEELIGELLKDFNPDNIFKINYKK